MASYSWVHHYLGFYSILLLLWLTRAEAAATSQESSTGVFVNCTRECGNITIPEPFGIEPGCFTNSWFRVTCNETEDGLKLFIHRINMEFIRWTTMSSDGTGTIVVNSPVTHVDCNTNTAAFNAINIPGSPYYFSTRSNVFGSIGCGNLVTIFDNRSNPISGILQPRCGNGIVSNQTGLDGSYAMTSANLTDYTALHRITSYTATLTQIYDHSKGGNDRCRSSIFMFGKGITDLDLALPQDINIDTKYVPAILEWTPLECDLEATLCQGPGVVPYKSGKCTEKCGDVDITYPFGIEPGCFMDEWFQVTCNKTSKEPKPFLTRLKLQILSISFYSGTVTVNNSVTYFNCRNKLDNGISIDLTDSPFFFSSMENRFGSVGCGNLVTIYQNRTHHLDPIGGCVQPRCSDALTSNAGCLMTIPPGVNSFVVNMTKIDPSQGNGRNNSSCGSAFMVDLDSLYNDKIFQDPSRVSVSMALEWGTPTYGLCELAEGSKIFCSPNDKYCWSNLSSTHLCVCNKDNSGYFTRDVCREAGKCGNPTYSNCFMLCLNTPDNHCPSLCPDTYEYDIGENTCKPKVEAPNSPLAKKPRDWAIIIGCSTSIGTIILLLGTWQMYKVLKRRKNIKLKQKYFKRNGGLLLQQQLSANEGNVEKIRLFTSKELEKATDYYNEDRILGQGGQGTVYKGMLTNGSIVAIKKSKMMEKGKLDENKLQQFINEVTILSQINHRNVVKLLGCCLETKVPLLVYEFIPNGTLSELIHNQHEDFPLTWELRFRIAIEIANALSYLHSAASVPIYHRDIKSSNILLDDKYRAKVSDFGTSRSVSLEQTHLTTQVQGTFGYLDPEYFRSNQFTEKSDVYSFGVVLIELLTGKKPVSSSSSSKYSGEVRSLVPFFLLSMKENSLSKILDPRVANDAPQEEIIAVAKLAKRCLNLNGKRRPTMKQVATELELIRASEKASTIHQQSDDDEDSDRDDVIQPWAVTSCSTMAPRIDESVTISLLDTTDD